MILYIIEIITHSEVMTGAIGDNRGKGNNKRVLIWQRRRT
jgi:hypothetical protein